MSKDVTILYVDDEEANRVLFKIQFSRHATIITAASVKEALIEINKGHINIVITDQNMPDENGDILLQELLKTHPDIIRVMCSAKIRRSPLEAYGDLMSNGIINHAIHKPWHETEVVDLLQSA